MAFGSVYFYLITALVAVNLIFAEDSFLSADNQADDNEVVSRVERALVTVCNYTATPGATCASCSQAMRCLPSNTGVLRFCFGLLPYCNNGRCSFIPPATCNTTLVG